MLERDASWALCVAPMIDVTDRHCRYFHRLLAPRARLYTEMISTAAIEHGDQHRLLDFDPGEQPVALQLGCSEPQRLAQAARIGERWGYAEINLNCGCPSARVLEGHFGAVLMQRPQLVADCLKAMQDAVSVPVTVKHRLGLGMDCDYGFVRDFVGILHDEGVRIFIVHARNAVLGGLSPKQNREIPPLRHDMAARLVEDFPSARFIVNGGIQSTPQAVALLQQFEGVMIGRAAWHTPRVLGEMHAALWPDVPLLTTDEVYERIRAYCVAQLAQGVGLRRLLQPLLGWAHGWRGARQWRRYLTDHRVLERQEIAVLDEAWQQLCQAREPLQVS